MANNKWEENSVYVLKTIEEMKEQLDQIFDKLTEIQVSLNSQQIKLALFTAAVAMIISPIIVLIFEKVMK